MSSAVLSVGRVVSVVVVTDAVEVARLVVAAGVLVTVVQTSPARQPRPASTLVQIYTTHTHTHTHTFNGPLSGTTRVSRYKKGKTNLDFTEAKRQ